MDRAEQALKTAEENSLRTQEALDSLMVLVKSSHPFYAPQVSSVTQSWLADEEKQVKDRLKEAGENNQNYQSAQTSHLQAEARLSLLRSQRSSEAEPLGDSLSEKELADQLTILQGKCNDQKELLDDLRKQREEKARQIGDANTEYNRMDEKIKGLENQVIGADGQAAKYSRQAEKIRGKLEGAWAEVLSSPENYQWQKEKIEKLRPLAKKLLDLNQAQGRLDQIDSDLRDIERQLDQVPLEYHVSLDQAQSGMEEAKTQREKTNQLKTSAKNDLESFQGRQERAEKLGKEMRKAEEEAKDWNDLSDLLKEGGPVQGWITSQVQQEIVEEINMVLNTLDDSLRVILGQPIRQSKTGNDIKDIMVVDEKDPNLDPQTPQESARHYNLLSGGEQFRIALAMALALHRRVAGNRPGTIIVDEGFGSLDSEHRDDLARQMADTSGGILRLKLAESIILCSHSSEVQREFPDRYWVEKVNGTAFVEPKHEEGAYPEVV